MGVHDLVRNDSSYGAEWHIYLWNYQSDRTLLPVSGTELVAVVWDSGLSEHQLNEDIVPLGLGCTHPGHNGVFARGQLRTCWRA